MQTECTFELYIDQQWQTAGTMTLLEPFNKGWQARTYIGYSVAHAAHYSEARDSKALSWTYPVSFEPLIHQTWPAFVIDLLPQGYGRQELLRQLQLPERAAQTADWALLCAGASNPIGNLRLREAYDWLQNQAAPVSLGFTQQAVAERGEQFADYIAAQGLFIAGSSGIQGEWPKLLLTQDKTGLFHLDHTLADSQATQHYLVKFARGHNPALQEILNLEAVWMELARFLGLRVHGELQLKQRALFIPRFDREITHQGLERYAQESLYALCQRSGFGIRLTHNQALQALSQAVTNPQTEILEYLKRDISNRVLGNTDNHGRNTAIQRRATGWIGLTPLFDFVPMVLHPEGIARQMRWEQGEVGQIDWQIILQQASQASGIALEVIQQGLMDFSQHLQNLPDFMCTQDAIPRHIRNRFSPLCEQTAQQLQQALYG